MSRDRLFEKVIRETLKELPKNLQQALGPVQILVQEKPNQDQKVRSGQGEDLFGLFEGLSLKEWPLGNDRHFPDRIILFRKCLKECYPKKEDLVLEIRKTLIHELGHYFGFTEKELRKRGLA